MEMVDLARALSETSLPTLLLAALLWREREYRKLQARYEKHLEAHHVAKEISIPPIPTTAEN